MFAGQTATFKKLHTRYELAVTQGHHSMEGRNIVAEATLKDYEKKKMRVFINITLGLFGLAMNTAVTNGAWLSIFTLAQAVLLA